MHRQVKLSMSAASKSNHVMLDVTRCDHRVWRSFAHPTLERAPGAQATEKPCQSKKHQPASVVGVTIQPLDHAFDRDMCDIWCKVTFSTFLRLFRDV